MRRGSPKGGPLLFAFTLEFGIGLRVGNGSALTAKVWLTRKGTAQSGRFGPPPPLERFPRLELCLEPWLGEPGLLRSVVNSGGEPLSRLRIGSDQQLDRKAETSPLRRGRAALCRGWREGLEANALPERVARVDRGPEHQASSARPGSPGPGSNPSSCLGKRSRVRATRRTR